MEACAEILRQVRRHRIRSVALMHALERDYPMDDWYGAIAALGAAGELNREERVFLIDRFTENPDLGPLAVDSQLEEIAETLHQSRLVAREEYFVQKWRMARETGLRLSLLRAWGDLELAHLAERGSHAWETVSLAGEEQYVGQPPFASADFAADVLAGETISVAAQLGDGTPEVAWCVSEIRILLARGIRSRVNFELGYQSVAPSQAWFRAIRALQEAGEIDAGRAAFLFERFTSVASDSPFLDSRDDSAAIEEESDEQLDARHRMMLIGFYQRLGEDAMANMIANDQEKLQRLQRRGKHDLMRSPTVRRS